MRKPKDLKHKTKRTIFGLATLGLLTGGGVFGAKIAQNARSKNRDKDKTEEPRPTEIPAEQTEQTFADFKNRMHSLTPAIMMETMLVEGIKLDENGLCKPYQDSKGIWTIGFGLTSLNGKSVTANTRHITVQDAWQKSIEFYEDKETYFFMWCYEVGMSGLNIDTEGKALCLASVVYNSATKMIEDKTDKSHRGRNEELRKLYKKHGDKITASQVEALFVKYPMTNLTSFGRALDGGTTIEWANALAKFTAEGGGIIWRRWLEGQMALGHITPKDLLDLPDKGMYDFWRYMGAKKNVLFSKDKDGNWAQKPGAIAEFKKWAQNPTNSKGYKIKRQTLRQILTEMDSCTVNDIENAKLQRGQKKKMKRIISYPRPDWQSNYDVAVADFNMGNYQSAAAEYESMSKDFPNDALILNDLAATYNKLGQHSRALECTGKIFNDVKDKTQYAAAYYNAGVAREMRGEYESALANYQNAQKYGNKSKVVATAIARVQSVMAKNKKMRAYAGATKKLNSNVKTVQKPHTNQSRGRRG